MVEQVITLEPEDDLNSIRDRLEWIQAGRVLLVFPPGEEPVSDQLGLRLIQRQAGRQQLELGIVCSDPALLAEARSLGIPVFPTLEIGQSRTWRWPWKPQEQERVLHAPPTPDPGDLYEMHRRNSPRPTWQVWLGRIGGLALSIMVLAVLFVAAVYIVPGADVTLYPSTDTLNVTAVVIGDPAVEESDYENGVIPARLIRVQVSWRGSAATTGFTDIPDAPATGMVVFINQQSDPVTVPSGTVVRTSAGTTIRFRTTRTVEVPGAVGGTIEAPIVAVDSGPWGNVEVNLINQIEGALALQLNVRNLSPTEGGGVRQVKAVTQADLDRLRGQVLQQLFQLAKAEMANWMTASEFLADESLALFLVQEEDFSRYVGEQADAVELDMTALIQGYVVDSNEGYGVVYTTLTQETPAGYQLIPSSISQPRRGEVLTVDDEGRVTFLMQGQATVAATIDQNAIEENVRGQDIEAATAWIVDNVPVEQPPEISVWPAAFGRMPYLPIRITTHVEMPG